MKDPGKLIVFIEFRFWQMLAFNTSFKDSWEEPGYRIFEAFGERWLLQLQALTVQFEP